MQTLPVTPGGAAEAALPSAVCVCVGAYMRGRARTANT